MATWLWHIGSAGADDAMPARELKHRASWQHYLVAMLVVLLGWLTRQALSPAVGQDRLPFIFFFPAIAVATWYGGLGPGVVATLAGALAADWFYIGAARTLGSLSPYDLVAMSGYLLASAFIVGAIESMHRARHRLLLEMDNRLKAEMTLSEEKEVLATTLASIGDAVIATDSAGRITFLNREASRLTGWTVEEAVGQDLPRVFQIVNAETRRPVEAPTREVLERGVVKSLANNTVLISKEGRETPIDDSAAPIRLKDGTIAGAILVFRDFTERQTAQRTSAHLATIVEHSGDAIITKNLNGIIQTWNAAAERLFGYTAQEVIGKPVTVLFPPDRLTEEDEILSRLKAGQLVERLETIRVSKQGRQIPVSVSISPIKNSEGQVLGASKIIRDVTELVSAREALVEEKELLATTLASIGDAVVLTDATGRVTFLNQEAERLTGWNTAAAASRPLAEVFRIVNEQTRLPVDDPVAKVLRLGKVVGLANHTILISKDGHETPIDDSAAPIRHSGGSLFGVVLVFRDFSAQRRTQRQHEDLYALAQAVNQARELSEIYDVALEAISRCVAADRAAILFVAPDGVMRFKAWRGLSEQYRRQVEGHSPWQADTPHPTPVVVENAALVESELRAAIQREGIGALGFIPISYEGKLLGKFMVYYNQPHTFTEEELRLAATLASQVALAVQRRRGEEQLENLVRERTARLREMMNELQHVSYAITHDMRAPLRAMSTFAGIILEELNETGQASPELSDACRRIIASAGRLDQLIQDALNYTKAVLQELPLHPVDLNRLIPSLIESYPNLQSDKADIQIEDSLPTVLGEESLLTQCFSNLLGNAVKFVVPGTRPTVRIRVHRLEASAKIVVEDNGIGIARDAQKRLFGMFERLTSGYEGTGIGLAIVRKVVERMGGTVGVESELGRGSKFWVELRTAEAQASADQVGGEP